MKRDGSVTVTFSLVFMVLFSFILSFFEMAAYTARMSYHASASLLAVENCFAGFLEPLYSQYHIFGREISEGKDAAVWARDFISKDVSFMTKKTERKSLLLRSGAHFSVEELQMLTDNNVQGFYSQAVTAMKYRGVVEIKELLQQFAGISDQTDVHMEVAQAKTETDVAYAKVEEKLLELIELVDGVNATRYQKYLSDGVTPFLEDAYVKFFYTDRINTSGYFERAQVYQAFLQKSKNLTFVISELTERVQELEGRIRKREEDEAECNRQISILEDKMQEVSDKIAQLDTAIKETTKAIEDNQKVLTELLKETPPRPEAIEELGARTEPLIKSKGEYEKEKTVLFEELHEWIRRNEEKKEELTGLQSVGKEQKAEVEALKQEETSFVKMCSKVRQKCEDAKKKLVQIREEAKKAKIAKENCERVINSSAVVLGAGAVKEYRNELERYSMYESTKGYDFDLMERTLAENGDLLAGVKVRIQGNGAVDLSTAIGELKAEKESLAGYSFEGLRLYYGEMSAESSSYKGLDQGIIEKIKSGILGFLTEESISERKLDTTYLPSGFRFQEKEKEGILSFFHLDGGKILKKMREMLPGGNTLKSAIETVTDSVLFHSYLTTHFDNFTQKKENKALAYETEYLIAGKSKDKDNLLSVVMQICVLRTILHFISLYSDSSRTAQVRQAAVGLCGVLALPALVNAVKFVLLLVWAVEEAMIDTAALLQGKKLLLYPGSLGGSLKFSELLSFSKQFVLRKASEKKSIAGGVFGYGEYLQIYLFLTEKSRKSYRALDLIQENLRKSYKDSFRVNRCVWKISYTVDGRKYSYSYEP